MYRQCKNPLPCSYDSTQFKLAGNGPPCCRKKANSPGCPQGRFLCPITGHCILKSSIKRCKTLTEFKLQVKKLNNYSQIIKGVPKLPSFVNSLKTVGGKNRDEKLASVRLVLSTCKKNNIPLLKKDGKSFKSFTTLKNQCKVVKFKSPIKKSPAQILTNSASLQRARARIANNAKLSPDFINLAFGKIYKRAPVKRYNVQGSMCNKKPKKVCQSMPNCSYTKRGCRRRAGTKSGAMVYEGPSLARFGFRI